MESNKIHTLSIQGSALFDLALSLPEPAHIKNMPDGKYLFTNKANLEVYSLKKTEDIINHTIYDLDSFMRPFWGEKFADRINNLELDVKNEKKTLGIKDIIFLDKNGFVHLQDITKVPIQNQLGDVVCIFTHSHDKTDKIGLLSLLKIYKESYPKQKEAREIFCKFLKIYDSLYEVPTEAELILLIYACYYNSREEISKKMHRCKKTIESHVTNLNRKIKIGNITNIINIIRASKASNLKA